MARNRTGWTTARVEKLLELNESGLTAVNIANELYKTFHNKGFKPSKSAVIGKLDRLGFKLGQARPPKPIAHSAPVRTPTKYPSFDSRWWASLSLDERVKILNMPTPYFARKAASESKRQFMDSNPSR